MTYAYQINITLEKKEINIDFPNYAPSVPSPHTHVATSIIYNALIWWLVNATNVQKAIEIIDQLIAELQSGKQSLLWRNQADGYAGLDSNGKIDPSHIPVIATTETVVVASQAERLLLSTSQVQRWDYAIQTDDGTKRILSWDDPTSANDWTLVSDTTPDRSTISNKPSTYPPSSHNHDNLYYTKESIDLALQNYTTSIPQSEEEHKVSNMVVMTQDDYTALLTKDSDTIYYLTD